MTTFVVVVLVVLLLVAALRLWITANRLDRLHVRTEAAWSALEGALARRVVATRAVAAAGGLDSEQSEHLRRLADVADRVDRTHRADAENDLSRALATMPAVTEPDLAAELADAGERVVLARRFYNDAVRDTRALRAVLFTRIFGLAGRAAMPDYFEIAEYPRVASAPVRRTAARVILLDELDRVLLLSGTDPQVDSRWWITPGGGVEMGEELLDTALRELTEETGFRLTGDQLTGPLWRREAEFTFTGIHYVQTEFYFVARAPEPAIEPPTARPAVAGTVAGPAAAMDPPRSTPDDAAAGQPAGVVGTMVAEQPAGADLDVSGHTDLERLTLTGHRWWSVQALVDTDELVYPVELAGRWSEVIGALQSGRAPEIVLPVD